MENVCLSAGQKHSVVVEVSEVLNSPSQEICLDGMTVVSQDLALSKSWANRSVDISSPATIASHETKPMKREIRYPCSVYHDFEEQFPCVSANEFTKPQTSEPKHVGLRLPSFSSLGVSPVVSSTVKVENRWTSTQESESSPVRPYVTATSQILLRDTVTQNAVTHFGIVGPLTPPIEEEAFKWTSTDTVITDASYVSASVNSQQPAGDAGGLEISGNPSSTRPSGISLPAQTDLTQSNRADLNWLDRAMQTILDLQGDVSERFQIQMVVQALPSQAKSGSSKPIFQEVAELLQQRGTKVPYVTITHAVSQVANMEEVPASPPATPNNLNTTDDYFDNQTIFTHAAAVPNYHAHPSIHSHVLTRPNGIITAPASIHVSTLERYIPPTTAQEVRDFFSISRRSYLVDRLTELSASSGSLLLVYPTAAGAKTFASRYIGPILDPFLRQFCLLNDLTTNAAARLGNFAALPAMMDFTTMSAALERLCASLTQRAPAGREPRSGYKVIHAEAANVKLDRATWMEWFIEQESSRFRQDLIDYQKDGGRMPARGLNDATPGTLARHVVDGLKNSREVTGEEPIEVGVFVVRRKML